MNDLKLDGLTGKTIKEAEVDGFGIRMVFTDGAVFEYSASDGGYSQYELTEATAEAWMWDCPFPERGDWLKGAVIHLAGQLRAVGDKFDIVRVEDDA